MALSFQEASKDKVLHSCPLSFGYLYEGVIPWGGVLPTMRGASPKGKVDVLTGVEREKGNLCP